MEYQEMINLLDNIEQDIGLKLLMNHEQYAPFTNCISKTNNTQVNDAEHFVKSVTVRSYFWSVFSCIRTEYVDLLLKSLYSVRIQENTNLK